MDNSLEQQKNPVKNSNKVNEPFIGDIFGGSKNPAKDLLSNVRPLLKESKDEIDGILDDLIEVAEPKLHVKAEIFIDRYLNYATSWLKEEFKIPVIVYVSLLVIQIILLIRLNFVAKR